MIPIRDLLLLCLSLLTVASAFTHSKQNRLRCQAQYSSLFDDTGDGGGSLFSSDVASMKSASGPKVQTDSNGKVRAPGQTPPIPDRLLLNHSSSCHSCRLHSPIYQTIEVGSTVRVSTGGKVTKAFHVTKKLHGSFESETKKFTPSDDDNFFVLPDGERSCPKHVCALWLTSSNIHPSFDRAPRNGDQGYKPRNRRSTAANRGKIRTQRRGRRGLRPPCHL